MKSENENRPFLSWLWGGVALGGVLLFAVATVKPLGVSTQYVRAAGGITKVVAPESAASNRYFQEEGIKFGYSEMLVLGIPLGALLAALATRRWPRRAGPHRDVPEPWSRRFGSSRGLRFAGALAGGFLLLFGARMAGGCTSGHILSGVSQLAVSSLLFFGGAFGAGVVAARVIYAPR